MSTEESVGLLSNTYISFPRVSFENECVLDTYAWHVTKKAPWHTRRYGAVYVGIVRAVLNSTVSLKHKRYRHVSSRWRRNVRVRRASYKVRVRCNIVRPNTAVQRDNAWLTHVPTTRLRQFGLFSIHIVPIIEMEQLLYIIPYYLELAWASRPFIRRR